jgi:hypothetical protein
MQRLAARVPFDEICAAIPGHSPGAIRLHACKLGLSLRVTRQNQRANLSVEIAEKAVFKQPDDFVLNYDPGFKDNRMRVPLCVDDEVDALLKRAQIKTGFPIDVCARMVGLSLVSYDRRFKLVRRSTEELAV